MTILLSRFVNKDILQKVAENINLYNYIVHFIKVSKGSFQYNYLICDIFESLVGALYFEHGFQKKKELYDLKGSFIKNTLMKYINNIEISVIEHIKNQLQNYSLKKFGILPRYVLVAKDKEDFIIACLFDSFLTVVSNGKTVKESETKCATILMNFINQSKYIKNINEFKSNILKNYSNLIDFKRNDFENLEIIDYDVYYKIQKVKFKL